MPMTVLSPFSGRPVKVRDQDVGRAVRDEEGRIFYIVEKADGSGYYAAPTRKGTAKDEQRYAELEAKTAHSESHVKHTQVHDATGPGRRSSGVRLLVLLIVLLLIAAGAYLAFKGTPSLPFLDGSPTPNPATPAEPELGQGEAAPPKSAGARLRLPELYDSGEEPSVNPQAFALLMAGRGDLSPSAEPSPRRGDAGLPSVVSVNATPAASPIPPQVTRMTPDALEVQRRRIVEALDQNRPFTQTASGLRYRVEDVGTGKRARAGQFVTIHYTVAHYKQGGESRVIDTSRRDNKPLGFVLWSGQVIRGWDEGIAGMREGERRTLIIPTELAGATGRSAAVDGLPEDNLLCEIELITVQPGVEHRVDRVGSGQLAFPGDTVEVHYTATIAGEDEPFDDSYTYGQPLRITIGNGDVIQGLELGVTGMAVGETRSITIPSYLGYGSRGAGSLIPANSALNYRVELLRVVED